MNKNLVSVLLVLVLAITGFIFYNSSKDADKSNEESHAIVDIGKDLIGANEDKAETNNQAAGQGQVNKDKDDVLNLFTRKMAHIFEFGLLGVSVMSLLLVIRKMSNKAYYGFGVFYCLFIAVCDEFLQNFTNRHSSVRDVLIDFVGELVGILLTILVSIIITKLKNKNKNKQ